MCNSNYSIWLDYAEEIFIECLNKSKIILGDDHVNTLNSMNKLSIVVKKQNNVIKMKNYIYNMFR
jgi:hypothetical protein